MSARRRDRDQQASGGGGKNQRRRGRAAGGNTRSGGGNRSGQQQSRRRGNQRRRNRSNRGDQLDPVEFWGDVASLPETRADIRITDDASAVPRSLGAPPLPGHEKVAEHYFRVVFERAVTTAGALAAAGGLIDPGDLVEDDDEG
jgi:hypothetical protein